MFRGNNLMKMNKAREVVVSEPPGWCGDRMQYWWAVEAMQWEKRVGMR